MNITVNNKIINEIYSNKLFAELDMYLNDIIDEELEKDDIDTMLIDECIDALDELRNGNALFALNITLNEKKVLKYCKRHNQCNSAHKRALAAGLVIMMLSAGAALNGNTAFANQAKEIFSSIISALNGTADRSNADESNVSSLYASFPQDYAFTIKDKDDIDLNSISIYAYIQMAARGC